MFFSHHNGPQTISSHDNQISYLLNMAQLQVLLQGDDNLSMEYAEPLYEAMEEELEELEEIKKVEEVEAYTQQIYTSNGL